VTASGFNSAAWSVVPFGGPALEAPPPVPGLKEALAAALAVYLPSVNLIGQAYYPLYLPQTVNLAAGPALTYHVVSSLHVMNLATAAGMRETRIRFTVFSYRHRDLETCLEILRNYWTGYKTILGGLPLSFAYLENEDDGYDEPIAGSDLGVHFKEFDYVFKFRESIPTNA
jgi:hypothetical protein